MKIDTNRPPESDATSGELFSRTIADPEWYLEIVETCDPTPENQEYIDDVRRALSAKSLKAADVRQLVLKCLRVGQAYEMLMLGGRDFIRENAETLLKAHESRSAGSLKAYGNSPARRAAAISAWRSLASELESTAKSRKALCLTIAKRSMIKRSDNGKPFSWRTIDRALTTA